MRFGIDVGTTRTVVAVCDRGNYPVVSFESEDGQTREFFPSVVAEKDGELAFGTDALAREGEAGWTTHRSFKRWLSDDGATPDRSVRIGSVELRLLDLMTGYLRALRTAMLERSSVSGELSPGEAIEAVIATPANSFSAQRLVMLAAARQAEIEIVALLNEPAAAGIEYAHRHRSTLNPRREKVLVYDLGGGTFDVSLVDMQGDAHDVLRSRGLHRLGGDDFDDALATLVFESAGIDRGQLGPNSIEHVLEHCRALKEAMHPNTKRLAVELGRVLSVEDRGALGVAADRVEMIAAEQYEQACAPLVDRTLELVRMTLDEPGRDSSEVDAEIAGFYVVGGASALPVIARRLRAEFGRKLRRSPYPSAATAIGLAIARDENANFALTERLHRTFGVFREGEHGARVVFDRLIDAEIVLPEAGAEPTRITRRYRASHNVGHYRFIECGWLDADGQPDGDIRPFADVVFPFDAALRSVRDLRAIVVERRDDEAVIEERYSIDAAGAIEVTIADLDAGFEQTYRLASSADAAAEQNVEEGSSGVHAKIAKVAARASKAIAAKKAAKKK